MFVGYWEILASLWKRNTYSLEVWRVGGEELAAARQRDTLQFLSRIGHWSTGGAR